MSYPTSLPFIAAYSLLFIPPSSCTDLKLSADMDPDMDNHQMTEEGDQEDAPPSYYASLNSNAKTTAVSHVQELPPSTDWFVRSSTDPTTWQLLTSGSLLSNVAISENGTPASKRRYRILYPPNKYEDVYLHRPPWTSQAAAFPPYHIEVYNGQTRYNAEPIVILGPPASEVNSPLTAESKAIASLHIPRVVSVVESQVGGMARQATFAETEYFSWDWALKTAGANHDMRTMILRAKEECARSVRLVSGMDEFLGFVGDDTGGINRDVLVSLRASCNEVQWKLERLILP